MSADEVIGLTFIVALFSFTAGQSFGTYRALSTMKRLVKIDSKVTVSAALDCLKDLR